MVLGKLMLNVFLIKLIFGLKNDSEILAWFTPSPEEKIFFSDFELTSIERPPEQRFHKEEVDEIQKYPYMASVLFNNVRHNTLQKLCSATILNPAYVLTAGHCVTDCNCRNNICNCTDYPLNELLVNVGNLKNNSGMKSAIKGCYFHPKFKQGIYDKVCTDNYDIAILGLTTPLQFNENVSNVVLPSSVRLNKGRINSTPTSVYIKEKKLCTIPGCFVSGASELNENYLGATTVQLTDIERCIQNEPIRYPDESLCYDSQVCTVVTVNKTGACSGDSGGPLICEGVQVGVATKLTNCTQAGSLSVYTRTDFIVKWIEDILVLTMESMIDEYENPNYLIDYIYYNAEKPIVQNLSCKILTNTSLVYLLCFVIIYVYK